MNEARELVFELDPEFLRQDCAAAAAVGTRELVVRIDPQCWEKGLNAVREVGQYDSWLTVWRIPFEGDWMAAVALCQQNGWIIATVIDPADRPLLWASPQFPRDGVTHYPCAER